MAYKALYRTYRPTNFNEMAGQKHIVQTLKNAVIRNKIAHAYLFCGPRGTGKTSIAKIFAKAVNCENSKDGTPCLICKNCLAAQEGNHPDVFEIDAASNNGVDEVRDLIEKVKYAPTLGKYKIYIIDEVHMMSTGAFNALLKTIEEPPAHVIFILATTEPHKVLPTIISRCQRYDFSKVSKEDIVEKLKEILDKENITYDDKVIPMVATLSDGGMRDALSILDQCIAYAQNDLKTHHINEIYGITTIQEKIDIFSHISKKETVELMNLVNTIVERGMDIKRLTTELIDLLKESIIYDYTHDVSILQFMDQEEVQTLCSFSSTDIRLQMIDVLMNTFDKYRNASNVASYFEIGILKLINIQFKPIIKIEEVKQQSSIVSKLPSVVENVSRETLPDLTEETEIEINTEQETLSDVQIQKHKEKTIKPMKDEFILRLMVGATKSEKNIDIQKMMSINDYMLEMKWAKLANLLKNGTVFVSSEQYIVLSVEHQVLANEINENDMNDKLLSFTNELFGKCKKVFAVTKEQEQRTMNLFIERNKQNNLPDKLTFEELSVPQNDNLEEETEIQAVERLFGKDNVILREE